jgi:bifunctional non-homologous end joining protein LigD
MSIPWPIAPMRAVNTRTVPRGDDWMYEPKWDGHRVLVRRTGEEFDAVSSTGKPKLPQWRWLASAVAAATDHDVVVDGEVIAYDADGRHTFQSVGRADRQHAFVVFDLLVLDGADLRGRPWSERRELLEVSGARHPRCRSPQ